jgi:electron transport complex protein RnfB
MREYYYRVGIVCASVQASTFISSKEEEMTQEVYERLADALDQLPNGFPRTSSGVELKILKKIFSPEEAELAGQLTGSLESIDKISARAGLSAQETRDHLFKMVRRGMVWLEKVDGRILFRLAPFVVGVYEASLEMMDHELAHLVEHYFSSEGARTIMGAQPALHRVVPAQNTIKSEQILPYEDVRAILLEAKTYNVRACICREQQDQLGSRRCEFPLEMCINFSSQERPPRPGDLTQAEVLALLDRSEEVGLVHTVNNVIEGVGYICNCCGCCCGIMRGITEWGIENSVAFSNYYAVIDPVLCNNCGTCVDRCQVHAISEGDGFSVVDRARCIGCGLCVTGCPNDVARLERKPETEIVQPPHNFAAWEHERLQNRGLIS